jgi:lipid II:glycine glycyltransferase (peptidoglycan interpeptide bridge formation enzyme)
MIDIRQTQEYAKYLERLGWKVERVAEINYFIKKIPVFGSVLKLQRPEEIRLSKVWELAKKNKSFQVVVEPKTQLDAGFLSSSGFKLSKSPYLPSKTLILDITQTPENLLTNMRKDARAAVLKETGPGLKIIGKNLQEGIGKFRSAWRKAVGSKRYVPPLEHLIALKESFKDDCLFLMEEGGSSGAIFLIGDKIAYYWQAFTNKEGRKNLTQYKIVWQGVKWAKGRGAKVFDFEGIYDERFPQKSWLGFTHFKKSFGGHEVLYPGCMARIRIPL